MPDDLNLETRELIINSENIKDSSMLTRVISSPSISTTGLATSTRDPVESECCVCEKRSNEKVKESLIVNLN